MAGNAKYLALRLMFEALWLTRAPMLARMLSRCRGVILTLHRVLPDEPADFSPNAILQVRPDFLEYVIERVRELGCDIVSLDEALERMAAKAKPRPFVVLTFDDGYRDNLAYALPVLRRQDAPFVLYIPTAFVDGTGEVWWQALEDIVADNAGLQVALGGEVQYLQTATLAEKQRSYDLLYTYMRSAPEPQRRETLHELARLYKFDLAAHCRELIMDWQQVRLFANDPLCTLGAHTVHHYELAKLGEAEARAEMEQSVAILAAQFGTRPEHFSYPIGRLVSAGEREYALARELGLRTAVTTRPGGLYPGHVERMTALPRVSLNGLFQSQRYVDVFASGSLFSLSGRLKAA